MRYQWNQLGRTENIPDLHKNHSGYICPSCGLEIYSEWCYSFSFDTLNRSISDRENEKKQIEEMQKEAVAFSQLKECPCCGGALKHDRHFFLQVENILGFGPKNFFENNISRFTATPSEGGLGSLFPKLSESSLSTFFKVNTVNNMFSYLHDQLRTLELNYFHNRITEISSQYGTQTSVTINDESVSPIKNDPIKLLDYLQKIIDSERNIRSLVACLYPLYKASHRVKKEAMLVQHYPAMLEAMQKRTAITEKIEQLQQTLQSHLAETSALQQNRYQLASKNIIVPAVSYPQKPTEPEKPVYETPGFFNKKKTQAENEAKTEQYNNALAVYNNTLKEYYQLVDAADKKQKELLDKATNERNTELSSLDAQIAAKNNLCREIRINIDALQSALMRIFSPVQAMDDDLSDSSFAEIACNLDQEITTAEALLAELFKQKNQLYGAGIIFEKYHDIVAVTTFYEYIKSGRCETLAGINGCYNLYESELRANIIINKLDMIGDSLEKIKENQYMLYSQLTAVNAELDNLHATTTALINCVHDAADAFMEQNETLIRNTTATAQNSAINAHNSSITAHNSAINAHNSAVAAYYAKLNAEIASSARYIRMICW